MQKNIFYRACLIAGIILISCLLAFPLEKKINLGLDLQGGIYLILRVDTSKLAEKSKMEVDRSGMIKKPIVTEIIPAGEFYKAEDYHQRYYQKNGLKPACHITP